MKHDCLTELLHPVDIQGVGVRVVSDSAKFTDARCLGTTLGNEEQPLVAVTTRDTAAGVRSSLLVLRSVLCVQTL